MGYDMHMVNIHVKNEYSPGDFALPDPRHQNGAMNIAAIRRRRGLTQIDLADLTKLTQPTISRAERGDDSATMGTYKSIAAALNVGLGELFADDRSELEAELLRVFRMLSDERQQGWLDMARLAAQGQKEPSE